MVWVYLEGVSFPSHKLRPIFLLLLKPFRTPLHADRLTLLVPALLVPSTPRDDCKHEADDQPVKFPIHELIPTHDEQTGHHHAYVMT